MPATADTPMALAERNRWLVLWALGRAFPRMDRDVRVRRLGNWDDCLQIGWLALLRACHLWDPARGQLSTYAARCIVLSLLREMRVAGVVRLPSHIQAKHPERARRIRDVRELPAGEWWGSVDDPPDATLLTAERDCALWRAYWELSPEDRALLRQRFLEGKSRADIAREGGQSKQWITHLTSRALARLAELLGGERP